MGIPETTAPSPVPSPVPRPADRGWGPVSSILLRFAFAYWLFYSLPLIAAFPTQLGSLAVEHLAPGPGRPSRRRGSRRA
ncbi:MAG TPA: hypothetical protein VGF55_10550 [Gemmataceae bacterium]